MKLNDANKAKQKQLVESREAKSKSGDGNNTSKDAGNKRKAPEASSSRANKRGRDNASTNATPTIDTEEEWVKKPEIKLTVPDILKVQLVDDWEAITKNCQVCRVMTCLRVLMEDFAARSPAQDAECQNAAGGLPESVQVHKDVR